MPERARHVAPLQTNAIVDPPCECALVRRRPSLSLYFAKLISARGGVTRHVRQWYATNDEGHEHV